MKVKTTKYGNNVEILKYAGHHLAVAVMVSDQGVLDSDGRKIVPAGTLVAMQADNEVTAANDETVSGVLLSDVDVTYGSMAGTMVIHGFIDKTKLPVLPSPEAQAALKMIEFL